MTPVDNHTPGLYRARDGAILGVCKGIARWREINVEWVRIAVILLAVLTSLWPVILIYVLLGMLLKPEPVVPFRNEAEREFYASYSSDRRLAVERLKRKFDHLSHRIERMEHVVTSPEFRWRQRMDG
jgi:phage shock protein C